MSPDSPTGCWSARALKIVEIQVRWHLQKTLTFKYFGGRVP